MKIPKPKRFVKAMRPGSFYRIWRAFQDGRFGLGYGFTAERLPISGLWEITINGA